MCVPTGAIVYVFAVVSVHEWYVHVGAGMCKYACNNDVLKRSQINYLICSTWGL